MELRARPQAFASSRTGRYAAALDVWGGVRRLPLRPVNLVAQVCKRLRANLSAAGWSCFEPAADYRPTFEELPTAQAERQ